jgi:hypothetical protein
MNYARGTIDKAIQQIKEAYGFAVQRDESGAWHWDVAGAQKPVPAAQAKTFESVLNDTATEAAHGSHAGGLPSVPFLCDDSDPLFQARQEGVMSAASVTEVTDLAPLHWPDSPTSTRNFDAPATVSFTDAMPIADTPVGGSQSFSASGERVGEWPAHLPAHGSHAGGLPNVPFDGYRAILHQGERVLTASEAQAWRAPMDNLGATSQTAYGAGNALALAFIAGATAPFGRSGAAVTRIAGAITDAIGQGLQTGFDAAGGLIRTGGRIVGGALAVGMGVGGAVAGGAVGAAILGPAGILPGIGVGVGVGLAGGALVSRFISTVSDGLGGAIGALGRGVGAVGNIVTESVRGAIEITSDLADTVKRTGGELATLRAQTGLNARAASQSVTAFGAVGLPNALSSITSAPGNLPALYGMRAGVWGLPGYENPAMIPAAAARFQEMQAGGLVGQLQARMMTRTMGLDSPESLRVLQINPSALQNNTARVQQFQSALNLDPAKIRVLSDEIYLLQARADMAVQSLRLRVAQQAFPILNSWGERALRAIERNAPEIDRAIQTGLNWLLYDAPPMVLRGGAAILRGGAGIAGGISAVAGALEANLPRILSVADELINGARGVVGDAVGILAWLRSGAESIGVLPPAAPSPPPSPTGADARPSTPEVPPGADPSEPTAPDGLTDAIQGELDKERPGHIENALPLGLGALAPLGAMATGAGRAVLNRGISWATGAVVHYTPQILRPLLPRLMPGAFPGGGLAPGAAAAARVLSTPGIGWATAAGVAGGVGVGYGLYRGGQALGLIDREQSFLDRMETGWGRFRDLVTLNPGHYDRYWQERWADERAGKKPPTMLEAAAERVTEGVRENVREHVGGAARYAADTMGIRLPDLSVMNDAARAAREATVNGLPTSNLAARFGAPDGWLARGARGVEGAFDTVSDALYKGAERLDQAAEDYVKFYGRGGEGEGAPNANNQLLREMQKLNATLERMEKNKAVLATMNEVERQLGNNRAVAILGAR